ncbi:MAG: hypothetical protein HND52_00330 [Ignavibacteriae bacterium]|nr:hypothetical protein [Ignavibacteriota bacterium]NOG96393.1 hypothetical protein [Ignavibacteriota bacterium]
MIKKIDEVINENVNGLHYGRRLLLPFVADILKIVIDDDILTDFNFEKSRADYNKEEYFTEINFMDYDNLQTVVSEFEQIKMIVVEEGENIFDFSTHRKIGLQVLDDHKIIIKEVDEDIPFIE